MAATYGSAYGMPGGPMPVGGGYQVEPGAAYRCSNGVSSMPSGVASGPSFDARAYGGADSYQMQQMKMMQAQMPQAGPCGAYGNSPYGAPPKLTHGLPDPASVERQKEGYMRSLEEQEQKSNASLALQRKQQEELIRASAEQQKKRLFMQIDQQVKTQEMALTQQYNQQLLQLNQQYHQQKAALEQQAMQLTMEYQQQRMQEEMAKKQMELHREHYEVQARFHADLQKLQGGVGHGLDPSGMPQGPVTQGHAGGSYVPPPMANGSYVPPPMPGSYGSSGSYVPPPVLGGASGSYVPPAGSIGSIGGGGGSYVPPGPAACCSTGSYVPPPGAGPPQTLREAVSAGSMPSSCSGVMQPNVSSYGLSAASHYTAPPTSYGPVPATHSYTSMNHSIQGAPPIIQYP